MLNLSPIRRWRKALPAVLVGSLLLTGLTGASPQPLLKPGGQVTVANVQVSAPLQWREVKPVRVQVRRVPLQEPPVPLLPGVKLATPVYAVSASDPVVTADAGRFVVRLPVGRQDPARLIPLRLVDPDLDVAPGGSVDHRPFWTSDSRARVKGGFVEFEVTLLPADSELFFTVARTD